jgi:hypothetical protein
VPELARIEPSRSDASPQDQIHRLRCQCPVPQRAPAIDAAEHRAFEDAGAIQAFSISTGGPTITAR